MGLIAKFILQIAVVLVVIVKVLYAAETTPAPKLCDLVCPYPLPNVTELLPSPERCEEYCQCDNRGAILQLCPIMDKETQERLYFNAEEQVCDWPLNSGCVNP